MSDKFNGSDAQLASSIKALLALDEKGVLVPHGVGGHARVLLEVSTSRLEARNEAIKGAAIIADAAGAEIRALKARIAELEARGSEAITVRREPIEWMKTNYPALCEKAGLCERIGGRLYTKTVCIPHPPTGDGGKDEWIDVADRLPDAPEDQARVHVLVARVFDGEWYRWSCWFGAEDRKFYDECHYTDEHGDECEYVEYTDGISHWMPLPGAPAIASLTKTEKQS